MTKKEWKKLDTIASKTCKDNADWTCEVCGRKDTQMHWHHYYGRKHTALRWYLGNLWCVCPGCHKFSLWSFHENPEWGRQTFLNIRGGDLLDKLEKIAGRTNLFDFDKNLELMTAPIEDLLKAYNIKKK